MSTMVARDRRVIELARQLGMPPYGGDAVAFVVTWCVRKVTHWVHEFGPRTLEEFLQTVTAKVGLIIDRDDVAAASLSVADLEAHRVQRSPQASREAAYSAIVSRLSRPALLIVAGLQLKANERRAMNIPALFPQESPTPKLRAVNVVTSAGARDAGGFLPKNMRVPPNSIIAQVFGSETLDLVEQTWVAHEDLSMWESRGEHRPGLPVVVEVGRCGSRVIALVTVRDEATA